MIFAYNLLNTALSVIGRQAVVYHKYQNRTTTTIGTYVPNYAQGIPITGSLQPVPRVMFEKLGLDFQKKYWTFYTDTALVDISRNVSGDRLTFNGMAMQVESTTDWNKINGWNGVLCVETGPDNVR